MNCNIVRELIEEYIMDELDTEKRAAVEIHLRACTACSSEYEKSRELISAIRGLKKSLKVKEDITDMYKRNLFNKAGREGSRARRALPIIAAGVFFALFVVSSSFVAFPTLAAKVVPNLPAVRELVKMNEENDAIKHDLEEIKQENEKLKMQIKEINGEKITEVITSDGISEQENTAIQELIIGFIKAQYKGDLEAIKAVCTQKYSKEVDRYKNDILKPNSGSVVFTQITNVAKEGDKYLVFVRLNDTESADDADYQENFEIIKVDGKFLVDFMGKDA